LTSSDEELARTALAILGKYKDGRVPQDKFVEELNMDSKEAMKLVSKLVKKGILKRETVIEGGKKVVYLYSSDRYLYLPVRLSLLSKVPCFKCKYLLVCKPGSNPNPEDCTILDEWLRGLQVA